jgi:pyridoxal 5'-phosphate synthase pdxT subunit
MKPVGVLALQGGVSEHENMLRQVGASTVRVRSPEQLSGVSALVLPGGESTTLISLLDRWGLTAPLVELGGKGLPMLGTCAGAILLSSMVSEAEHTVDQRSLGLADVRVVRNSFGRQVRSFVADLSIKGLSSPFPGVFVRAPLLEPLSDRVEVLCSIAEGAVLLRQGCIWLSSFHPELTPDTRLHRLFLQSSGLLREST